MPKFRLKPIEAHQWFPGTHVDGVQEVVHDPGDGSTASGGYGMLGTSDPERVSPGDWIIVGFDHARQKTWRRRVSDAEFRNTYEEVTT